MHLLLAYLSFVSYLKWFWLENRRDGSGVGEGVGSNNVRIIQAEFSTAQVAVYCCLRRIYKFR